MRGQPFRGAAGGHEFEAHRDQIARGLGQFVVFVAILDREEHAARVGQHRARAKLRFPEGAREVAIPAHDFAGRAHFRPQQRIDTGEAREWHHRLFDREPRRDRIGQRQRIGKGQRRVGANARRVGRARREIRHRLARHQTRGNRGNRAIGRLGNKGHGARGARVDLKDVNHAILDRELHVHQADHIQPQGHLFGLHLQLGHGRGIQRIGRQRAGRIARMHAGLFDVLHDARDMHGLPVTQRVNVHLDRARQVAVQQHGAVTRHDDGTGDIALELVEIAHDFHRAPAQHIGRADHQRIANTPCNFKGFRIGMGNAVDRLLETKIVEQFLEPLAIFGQINGVGRGAQDRDALGFQRVGQFQRRLPAELHDHPVQRAVFLLDAQDFKDMFQCERFEIQPVRSVVISADRLGVAVDHDRFIARVGQRETGVTAAVVKLDPLPDPVRTAAQNDHFLAIARAGLAFHIAHRGGFVGGIHIRRLGLEFGGTGINPLEAGLHAQIAARPAHLCLVAPGQRGQAGVAEAHHLELAQPFFIQRQPVFADLGLGLDDFADTREEPRVIGGGVLDVVIAQPVAHRLCNQPDPVGGLRRDRLDHCGLFGRAGNVDLVEAAQPCLHRRERLLHRFVEGAADRHGLAHRFHCGSKFGFGTGEFLKREARDFRDDIVNCGFKAGGGDAGDVIVELVQRVADRQFGGDLGNRKPRRLGSQSGRPRHPRVHLDHDHAAIFGVDRPLHIRAAGFDADLAQHGDRAVAHDLVFLVRQRQGRGDGDRIAGMHAHRIDVFDGANDDRVIGAVAHDLHLEFFPAQQRFIDQNLRHRRGIQPRAANRLVIVAVIGHAATGAAQREGGADDRGQADMFKRGHRLGNTGIDVIAAIGQFRGGDDRGLRVLDADPVHRLAKQLAVFGHFDGIAVRADQLDAEFFQHAHIGQRQRGVQPGLPAHRGQQRVGAFLLDDLGNDFGGDRFDIGGIGKAGIGHDRGRVGVHQDHPVALFAQRLAGLCAGIVELAGLPDDDGPGTDDEDGLDVGSLRHDGPLECWRSESRGRVVAPTQIVGGYRPTDARCKGERLTRAVAGPMRATPAPARATRSPRSVPCRAGN